MTLSLQMEVRTTRWGSFAAVDLPAIGAGEFEFEFSYSHASMCKWTCLVPQHTAPLAQGSFVRIWIAGENDPDDVEFSDENPLFEGYIESVDPGSESIGVSYTAFDPTFRATKKVTIFSAPWPAGTVPDDPPLPPANGVPRLLYNVSNQNDPDYSHQVGGYGTLYQIIAGILEFCYQALVWCDAAPGDGVDPEIAYDNDELSALTVQPQEKWDFQSESPRSAIERLQRQDPRLRLFWEPGTRLWRVRPITTAPTTTLTLNRRDVDFPVLSLQLRRSTEQCVTAIRIYGPPTVLTEDLRWDHPDDPAPTGSGSSTPSAVAELTPLGDPVILETYSDAGGSHDVRLWREFQITDPALRRNARVLADWYTYQRTPTYLGETKWPMVLISFDYGATWCEWPAFWLHPITGILTFTGAPAAFRVTRENGTGMIAGSTQTWFVPNAIRLICAPYDVPLQVRRPESGYEGTAYTDAGVEIEDFQNDVALAIGWEYGNPVTSSARRAAFETYAQTLLDQRKDVVWTGVAVLDGLDWQFCRLNKTCRIVAQDGSGNEIDTPWNDVDAYVTDVAYDLENQTTTLTFSADRLALFGIDPESFKRQLGIKTLTQVVELQMTFLYGQRPLPSGKLVTEVIGVDTQPVFHYVDPEAF